MSSSSGKRYNGERKLNLKKVFAVIMVMVIVVLFIMVIVKMLNENESTKEKSFTLAYYTIFENNRWGVIDSKANVIIEPTYDEMIIIPDNTKDVFVCTYDVNYEKNTYKSKIVNKDNNQIYLDYDKVEVIYNKDKSNNLWYEKNVLKVQKDGKYGLINYEGKNILPCEYESIDAIEGVTSVFVTVKDSKKGLCDNVGNIIIENDFAEIKALTSKYENGFIVKSSDEKYGIIKYNTVQVFETKFDDIKSIYANGMYVVKIEGKWKVINEEEEIILDNDFSDIKFINSDNIIYVKDGKFGIVNSKGEEKIANEYEDIKYAFVNTFIAKKDGKYGVINGAKEEKVAFTYNNIEYIEQADILVARKDNFEADLLNRNLEVKVSGIVSEINTTKNYIKLRAGEEYKYFNFKLEEKESKDILTGNTLFLSKKDGKYGYINNKGIVVVDYIYDDATEQNNYGYASVKKDGKWGSINQKGNIIVEPKYELENNLVIDFIGSWHITEDINAEYYTR